MPRLKDKVGIVTGGSAGIGQATAILFAEEGAKVTVADLDEAGGEETVAQIRAGGGQAIFTRCDISQESQVAQCCRETVRAFGRIDVLVNNAATFVLKGLEATVEEWNRSLSVNVIGTALCCKYAAEEMRKVGKGAIVNLASMSGFIAQPGFVAYSATKAAILQMTRNLALDLAPFGIRVNSVCPGTILTRASREHMARVGMKLEDFLREEGRKHLLNRVGEPREVAYAILFLASDEASFITGAHLMVDGGYTAV
jgi:NAD(P)-dependent dehydrogenase (short-subunit alcohol dehydrogenase family)